MLPAHSAGIPEFKFYYFLIVPIHPRLQGGAFSAPAGKKLHIQGAHILRNEAYLLVRPSDE